MAERQSTYDLSSVFRALGIRTARAVPSLAAVELVPVVQVGDFSSTFAPEVIESRGITSGNLWSTPAGQWSGCYLQSLAPGGLVIETFEDRPSGAAPQPAFFQCSSLPWVGGTFVPIFTIGGGSVASRFNFIIGQALPLPDFAGALGPGQFWDAATGASPLGRVLDRWYVAPGQFVGTYIVGQVGASAVIRFREIPEAQGPV